MPNAENLDDDTVIDRFLPWSEEVPNFCKLNPEAASKAKEMADDPIIDIDPEEFVSED